MFLPERLDCKGRTGSAADDEDVGVRSVVGRDLDCRRGRLPSLSDRVGVGVDIDGRAIGLDLVAVRKLVSRRTAKKKSAVCANRRLTLKLCNESIPGASSMSPLLQTSALEKAIQIVSAATSGECTRKGNEDSLKQAPCHGLRKDGRVYSIRFSTIPSNKYRKDRCARPIRNGNLGEKL